MIDLVKLVTDTENTVKKIITSSEKYAKGLRELEDRGFSDKGMLEKCIEITAIQSQQIRFLATICLSYVKTEKFASDLAIATVLQNKKEKNKENE